MLQNNPKNIEEKAHINNNEAIRMMELKIKERFLVQLIRRHIRYARHVIKGSSGCSYRFQ